MTRPDTKPSLELGSFSLRPRYVLAGIILLAFALRLVRLDFQPLWWDEGYSLFFATRDFATLLERTAVDIHPPFYYALLQIWISLVGKSDIAVRMLSVFIGVATIPFLYSLARRLFATKTVALLAAFLLAIAPLHVYYSQEVRMYGLVTLLCLGSIYFFVRLYDSPDEKNIPLWSAYVLSTTTALYTQYFAVFVVAFQIILVAVTKLRITNYQLRFSHWLFAWLTIALLYSPWTIFAGEKLYTYVTFKVAHEAYSPQNPITYFLQHLIAFSSGHVTEFTWLAWGSVIFVAIAALGLVTSAHGEEASQSEEEFDLASSDSIDGEQTLAKFQSNDNLQSLRNMAVPLYLLLTLALGYLVHLRFPFYPIRVERLLLLAAPAFYLLVALGVAALMTRRYLTLPTLFIVSALSGLSLYDFYTAPRYPSDDYRPLIAEIQSVSQPGDLFLAIYPWQIGYLESYYADAPLTIIETPNDAWIGDRERMQRDLESLLSQHPRVWVPALQTLGRTLEDSLDSYLRANKYSVTDTWFGTTRLEYFAAYSDPPPSTKTITFENGLAATWSNSSDRIISGNDIVRLWFGWSNNTPSGLKLSLRLLDQNGNLWLQEDREIERGEQRIGLFVPSGTPPGKYDLRLSVYRVSDSSKLHFADNSDVFSLGQVVIDSPTQSNRAAVTHRVSADFENEMRLVGYAALTQPVKPGDPAGITLFWESARPQTANYSVSIQLQDMQGKIVFEIQESLARGIYPSTLWRDNELVRDPHTFTVSGNIPDGSYRLLVALANPADQTRSSTKPIATVQVKGRMHYFGAPSPTNVSNFRIGDFARLVGYDTGFDSARKNLKLILYWRAIDETKTSYKVFAHIVDANGNLLAQHDQFPGSGAYATTTWAKGEYLVDPYDIPLAELMPNYQIRIGLYDPTTGARLPVYDSSNKMTGDSIVLPVQ